MLLLILCGAAVVAYLFINLLRFRLESKQLKKDLQILRHNKQIRREYPHPIKGIKHGPKKK